MLVERFVQNAYFAFQIVQVFLITTITSAASGALTKILANPMTAKDLLAENLPKASNFYLSYILIQCLANGAFGLLHVFELFRHHILSRVSALPRARFRIWRRMRVIHYGGVYPVFTNMGVIGKLTTWRKAFIEYSQLLFADTSRLTFCVQLFAMRALRRWS